MSENNFKVGHKPVRIAYVGDKGQIEAQLRDIGKSLPKLRRVDIAKVAEKAFVLVARLAWNDSTKHLDPNIVKQKLRIIAEAYRKSGAGEDDYSGRTFKQDFDNNYKQMNIFLKVVEQKFNPDFCGGVTEDQINQRKSEITNLLNSWIVDLLRVHPNIYHYVRNKLDQCKINLDNISLTVNGTKKTEPQAVRVLKEPKPSPTEPIVTAKKGTTPQSTFSKLENQQAVRILQIIREARCDNSRDVRLLRSLKNSPVIKTLSPELRGVIEKMLEKCPKDVAMRRRKVALPQPVDTKPAATRPSDSRPVAKVFPEKIAMKVERAPVDLIEKARNADDIVQILRFRPNRIDEVVDWIDKHYRGDVNKAFSYINEFVDKKYGKVRARMYGIRSEIRFGKQRLMNFVRTRQTLSSYLNKQIKKVEKTERQKTSWGKDKVEKNALRVLSDKSGLANEMLGSGLNTKGAHDTLRGMIKHLNKKYNLPSSVIKPHVDEIRKLFRSRLSNHAKAIEIREQREEKRVVKHLVEESNRDPVRLAKIVKSIKSNAKESVVKVEEIRQRAMAVMTKTTGILRSNSEMLSFLIPITLLKEKDGINKLSDWVIQRSRNFFSGVVNIITARSLLDSLRHRVTVNEFRQTESKVNEKIYHSINNASELAIKAKAYPMFFARFIFESSLRVENPRDHAEEIIKNSIAQMLQSSPDQKEIVQKIRAGVSKLFDNEDKKEVSKKRQFEQNIYALSLRMIEFITGYETEFGLVTGKPILIKEELRGVAKEYHKLGENVDREMNLELFYKIKPEYRPKKGMLERFKGFVRRW